MNKPIFKLKFSDFCPFTFNDKDNFFTNVLSKKYDLKFDDNPDFLIYSSFGFEYAKYGCIRIYYTGENDLPDINECDWAFSHDFNDFNGRNFRLPYYVFSFKTRNLWNTKNIDEILASKTSFCNFIYSNANAQDRIDFFRKLSKYKRVDAGGKVMNNLKGQISDKLGFIKNYKFTIAFENSSIPGYTTEKLIEPLQALSVPIYWGNPLVAKDFESNCFINVHDFKNFDEAIDYVKEVDNNDGLYKKYLKNSPGLDNSFANKFMDEDKILDQFERIYSLKDQIRPVSQTWKNSWLNFKLWKSRMIHRIIN